MFFTCLNSKKEEIPWPCSLSPQLTRFFCFPLTVKQRCYSRPQSDNLCHRCVVSASVSLQLGNTFALLQDCRHSRPCCHTEHYPHVLLSNHSFPLWFCFQTTETVKSPCKGRKQVGKYFGAFYMWFAVI